MTQYYPVQWMLSRSVDGVINTTNSGV